jgi:electron transfer flavoprotein beta subunit
MANSDQQLDAQTASAESSELSFLEQAITATKQTARNETEELLRTLTKEAVKGTVKWDKNLSVTINSAIAAIDGMLSKQLAEVIKNGGYDLVIAGKESLDYNGGMVPGMLAGILGYNFVNSCTELKVDGTSATASREIDGGKETVSTSLPLIIGGQKGLVEEKDLRIPNMRGIMTARTKALTVLEPVAANNNTKAVKFEKPAPKSAVKLVSADNLDELINLLHNEAKVI